MAAVLNCTQAVHSSQQLTINGSQHILLLNLYLESRRTHLVLVLVCFVAPKQHLKPQRLIEWWLSKRWRWLSPKLRCALCGHLPVHFKVCKPVCLLWNKNVLLDNWCFNMSVNMKLQSATIGSAVKLYVSLGEIPCWSFGIKKCLLVEFCRI